MQNQKKLINQKTSELKEYVKDVIFNAIDYSLEDSKHIESDRMQDEISVLIYMEILKELSGEIVK